MKTIIPRKAAHFIDAANALLGQAYDITYEAHSGRPGSIGKVSPKAELALNEITGTRRGLWRLAKL